MDKFVVVHAARFDLASQFFIQLQVAQLAAGIKPSKEDLQRNIDASFLSADVFLQECVKREVATVR